MPTYGNIILIITLTVDLYVNSSQDLTITSSGESDEADTLKQALYLVKLLKSDRMKLLRDNSEFESNIYEEDNSTCPERSSNSTNPMDSKNTLTETTPKVSSVVLLQSHIDSMPLDGAAAFASPANHYSPPATSPGNIPPDYYKYPYRFHRRRMVPDYYYYDIPTLRYENYRRFGHNIPDQGLYRQERGTDNYRRFGHSIPYYGSYRRGYERGQSEAPEGTKEETGLDPDVLQMNKTMSTTTSQSKSKTVITKKLSNTIKTEKDTLQHKSLMASLPAKRKTTMPSTLQPLKIVKRRSRKAFKRHLNKKIKKAQTFTHQKTGTKKPWSEDVLFSQVASELINEIRATTTEHFSAILRKGLNR